MLYLDPDVYARRWRTLPVLCLSLAVVMIANGSLNIALPALARDLDASPSALQWMVDGYALVFAGLLFTAGTLGDRFGRKGALQAGLVLFLLAAVMATFADTRRAAHRVPRRDGRGRRVRDALHAVDPHQRLPAGGAGRAIGLWAGIAAGGAALGPVTTGFLLEHFWWGSVFLVNVPLIVLALVAGARLVPKSPDRRTEPLDLPGALLSIVAIATLVYAIIEAPAHGWASSHTLLAFAAAAVLLGAFLLREHHAAHPMIDLALFRDVRFSVASAGIALSFFAMFGTFFLVTQYLQLVLGYRPVVAGLTMLPISLTMMVLAPQAPKLVARFGAARVVGIGLGLTSLGLVAFATLGTSSPVGLIYLAYVPMMIGMSVSMSPLTTLIMSSVPAHRAGIGSAMNDTTRELGGALGVAVLGSLLTTGFAHGIGPALGGLGPDASATASTGLAGTLDVARGLPGGAGAALGEAARAAYVDGMGTAALAAAGVVAVTAFFAARLLPGRASTSPDVLSEAIPARVLEPVGRGLDASRASPCLHPISWSSVSGSVRMAIRELVRRCHEAAFVELDPSPAAGHRGGDVPAAGVAHGATQAPPASVGAEPGEGEVDRGVGVHRKLSTEGDLLLEEHRPDPLAEEAGEGPAGVVECLHTTVVRGLEVGRATHVPVDVGRGPADHEAHGVARHALPAGGEEFVHAGQHRTIGLAKPDPISDDWQVLIQSTSPPPLGPRQLTLLVDDWRDAGHGALSQRLAHVLRSRIASGLIAGGTRLPPERAIAVALEVSRSTVVTALDELRAGGFVISRQGSGTRVVAPATDAGDPTAAAHQLLLRVRHRAGEVGGRGTINLAASVPGDASHLPDLQLDGADLVAADPAHGYAPTGLPALRDAIAARHTGLGLPTAVDQVHVTNGAQHALDLALGAVTRAG